MTRRLPRSTFGLAALASLALAIATVVLGTVVYLVSHEALEQQLDHRIAAETDHLQATMTQQGPAALVAAIGRREDGHGTSEMGYMLFGPSGDKIAGRLNAARPAPGWHELLPFRDVLEEEHEVAQALVTPLRGNYTLVVAADRTPIDEIDATVIRMFAVAFGTMLVIGIACAWMLGLVVRRRLRGINTTAEAIIGGDIGRRIARDTTRNEFDQLAETLNRMLDRNQQLLENLQQVSSDIAHDLRTPLARQKQLLDRALEQELDAPAYRDTIDKASSLGEDILELFSALLRISEIQTYQIRTTFQPVDLAEIVQRVAEAFRIDAEITGHALTCTVPGSAEVFGDRHLLSQLVVNLVENGLRHTPAGTTVRIGLARAGGAIDLTVTDDGPGVPPADRARILQRFYRLEKSRSTPGYGLGMSLVAAIAEAHFASLSLDDGDPGLKVTVRFATYRDQ